MTTPFFFSGQSFFEVEPKTVEITSIQTLRNRSLLAYIDSRKISPSIAAIYLNEVRYRIGDKNYYAVGFRNDKGGFELRNPYFKGCTSPKWFTYIPGSFSTAINVFEGVFDFLSCCQYFNVQRLKNPTIVLNSLSFLTNALPTLSEFGTVNAFLDNDKSGKRALERLKKEKISVRDCSNYYPSSKDFNESLINMA